VINYYDLRNEAADAQLSERLLGLTNNEGAYLCAWQLSALPAATWLSLGGDRLVVTVPDFLNYARLLNTGQARTLMNLPGSAAKSMVAGMAAGIPSMPKLLRLAKMDFWAIAGVLLRYDLQLLPRDFAGSVCLHSHLTDFACAFEREDFIRMFYKLAGRSGPAGFHTQQLAATASCLTRWSIPAQLLSVLCASGDRDGFVALQAATSSGPLRRDR
jgi:hypothetical protein